MFDSPIITNDLSVNRVLNAGLPVVLVFLNGPAAPDLKQTMEQIAKKYAGKLLLAQVQGKENPQTLQKYGVRSLPALVMIKQGKEISQEEGINPGDLTSHVKYLLGEGPKPQQRPSPGTPTSSTTAGHDYAQGGRATSPITVTDASFDREVMSSNVPVLVDFWAPWCGPCKMADPVVAKLAGEMSGRLKVAKVNVDENPAISQRFAVMSIPTMMIVKNGKITDRWVGAQPEAAIRNRVLSAIGQPQH